MLAKPFPQETEGEEGDKSFLILIISIEVPLPSKFSDVKMAAARLNTSCHVDRIPQKDCGRFSSYIQVFSKISFLAMCVAD